MSTPTSAPGRVIQATRPLNTGGNGELRPTALIFLVLLWLSLFVAFAVLITLLITIFLTGQNKLTWNLVTNFPSADPRRRALVRRFSVRCGRSVRPR